MPGNRRRHRAARAAVSDPPHGIDRRRRGDPRDRALCAMSPRLAPATRCTLWWLAALKLIVALVWIEPVVLRVLANFAKTAARPRLQSGSGEVRPHASAWQSANDRPHRRTSTGAPSPSWRAVAAALWIVGALAGSRRDVRPHPPNRADRLARARRSMPTIRTPVRELCRRAGVRRVVGVRWSGDIDAPMIAGLLRPVILLPADRFGCVVARRAADGDLPRARASAARRSLARMRAGAR